MSSGMDHHDDSKEREERITMQPSALSKVVQQLIRSTSAAFDGAVSKPGSVPNEVLLTLLQLTEFMDRQGEALPVMKQKLGRVAELSHSYAKALYYKEKEFGL